MTKTVDGIDVLIRNYIKERGITQSEFAKLIGKTQAAVSQYVNKVYFPTATDEVEKLSHILNMPIGEVVEAVQVARHGVVKEHEPMLIDLSRLSQEEFLERYNFTLNGEKIPEDVLADTLDFLRFKFERYQK